MGGSAGGAGNVISGNGQSGVGIDQDSSSGNAILSNSVYGNGDVGIDLKRDGVVNPNDERDPDDGPNKLQNFPVIESASSTNGATTVTGTLNSTPNRTFTVQVFRNSAAVGPDPSGHGEGETFVANATVNTDADGNGSFTVTETRAFAPGTTYAATATSSTNDTSEFSKAVAVQERANIAPTVAPSASNPTTVDEGETKIYSFSIDDPDAGDTFTYRTGFPEARPSGSGSGGVSQSTNVG